MLNRIVKEQLGQDFVDKVKQVKVKKHDIASKEYTYIFTLWNGKKVITYC